jgi:RNA polymerase sigma-70 factor (ECF subfamily)
MSEQHTDRDEAFKAELITLIPHLRAFARSLAWMQDGDDLAQDTVMRAWRSRDSYQEGTSMKSWAFTIMRNQFLSDKRRSWRTQPLEPGIAENQLVAPDSPAAREELVDVRNAMQHLPEEQREALILVGAAGLSYDEAAAICGCAIGTIKSRVSRARVALGHLMQDRQVGRRERSDVSAEHVFDDIMQAGRKLQSRAAAA